MLSSATLTKLANRPSHQHDSRPPLTNCKATAWPMTRLATVTTPVFAGDCTEYARLLEVPIRGFAQSRLTRSLLNREIHFWLCHVTTPLLGARSQTRVHIETRPPTWKMM
jgi:hypothetical protein